MFNNFLFYLLFYFTFYFIFCFHSLSSIYFLSRAPPSTGGISSPTAGAYPTCLLPPPVASASATTSSSPPAPPPTGQHHHLLSSTGTRCRWPSPAPPLDGLASARALVALHGTRRSNGWEELREAAWSHDFMVSPLCGSRN
jgi:hypothetical protein